MAEKVSPISAKHAKSVSSINDKSFTFLHKDLKNTNIFQNSSTSQFNEADGERLAEFDNVSSPVFKNEYEQTEPNIASLIEACW